MLTEEAAAEVKQEAELEAAVAMWEAPSEAVAAVESSVAEVEVAHRAQSHQQIANSSPCSSQNQRMKR